MSPFTKHYGAMWIVFVILVFVGALGLEIMEGLKITTTEYYGLTNLGNTYLVIIFFLICFPSSVLYFVAVLPLSVLLRKGTFAMFFVRTNIFIVLGAAGGKLLFQKLFMDHLIKGYDLNEFTAIIIFGACGLAYSLIDAFLMKKADWVIHKSQ